MPLNPNIPLQARAPQMPSLLGMMQQAETFKKMRAGRKMRERDEAYRSGLAEMMQQPGMNLESASQGLMGQFPLRAQQTGLAAMGQRREAARTGREEDVYQRGVKEQLQQKMGLFANRYLQMDPQQKVEQFANLRRGMRDSQIPEPPGWGEKTEYDADVERDLQMASQMFGQPEQVRGPDYARKLQYEKKLQDIRSAAKPTEYQKAMMEQMGVRMEDVPEKRAIEKAKLGIKRAELGIKKKKVGFEEKELGFKEEKAVRAKKKDLQAHKAMKMKKASQITEINEFIRLADSLAANKSLSGVTGVGKVGKIIPGTPWADVNADLERLLSMGAIASMVKMKAESPTGSTGFGALSQKELKVIQDSFASLENTNQSPSKMRQELRRISNSMKNYLDQINKFETETTEEADLDPLGLGL